MALTVATRLGQHVLDDTAWRRDMRTVTTERWDELKRHAAVRVQIRRHLAVKPVPTVVITRFGQIGDERETQK